MSSNYEIFKQAQAALEQNLMAAAKMLGEIPGIGTGPMGLTPDAVRATPDYRKARAAYDAAFSALRSFNGKYIKIFKTEIRAERAERLAKREQS